MLLYRPDPISSLLIIEKLSYRTFEMFLAWFSVEITVPFSGSLVFYPLSEVKFKLLPLVLTVVFDMFTPNDVKVKFDMLS